MFFLTVRDNTLCGAKPKAPEKRAPLEVQKCSILEQTETFEHSSAWTEKEADRLIRVWRESYIQAKLQVMYRSITM